MDYSKLSDAEISQKVWFWWNSNVPHDGKLCGISGDKMLYVKNRVWTAFDPCNNPADAWPIIFKNSISMVWDCAEDGSAEWWNAFDKYDEFREQYQSNPLRAAMIVFLMMQEDACKTK
jgi:hypothetical protein